MLLNYLVVGWRSLWRGKLFACISVAGLGLGLACCILMGLFVVHEWRFDGFHEHRANLYRVIRREVRSDGRVEFQPLQDMDLAPRLVEELPEVIEATSLIKSGALVSKDDKLFEEQILLADASALRMFTFPLLAGAGLSDQASGVLLVEDLARRLLGSELPFREMIGQTVTIHGWAEKFPRTVVGVLSSLPSNSSLQFAAVLPFEEHQNFSRRQTMDGFTSTWMQLRSDADLGGFSSKLDRLVNSLFAEKLEQWKADGHIAVTPGAFQLVAQPMGDVHFDEGVLDGYESKGRALHGRILAGLSVVVLLLACVNFATLSIARLAGRFTEVGIRKSVGATRRHITWQHLIEATLVTTLSMGVGLVLAEWVSPYFSLLTSQSISLESLPTLPKVGILVALSLVTAISAGGYPAFLLARSSPSTVLRGDSPVGRGPVVIRYLLTAQVAVSIAFIAATFAMAQQLSFVHEKGLGFDEHQLLTVRLRDPRASEMRETIKNEMLRHPGVLSATLSDRVLVGGNVTYGMLKPDGTRTKVRVLKVDGDYLATMRIPLVAGKNFDAGKSDDVIINAQLVQRARRLVDRGPHRGCDRVGDRA